MKKKKKANENLQPKIYTSPKVKRTKIKNQNKMKRNPSLISKGLKKRIGIQKIHGCLIKILEKQKISLLE